MYFFVFSFIIEIDLKQNTDLHSQICPNICLLLLHRFASPCVHVLIQNVSIKLSKVMQLMSNFFFNLSLCCISSSLVFLIINLVSSTTPGHNEAILDAGNLTLSHAF